jgi:hypothetical protein
MYKELIKRYISHLKLDHIKEYAKSQNIILNQEEAQIIYDFILKNYNSLLEDNTTILGLKKLIREDLYNTIFLLYQKKKTKYL